MKLSTLIKAAQTVAPDVDISTIDLAGQGRPAKKKPYLPLGFKPMTADTERRARRERLGLDPDQAAKLGPGRPPETAQQRVARARQEQAAARQRKIVSDRTQDKVNAQVRTQVPPGRGPGLGPKPGSDEELYAVSTGNYTDVDPRRKEELKAYAASQGGPGQGQIAAKQKQYRERITEPVDTRKGVTRFTANPELGISGENMKEMKRYQAAGAGNIDELRRESGTRADEQLYAEAMKRNRRTGNERYKDIAATTARQHMIPLPKAAPAPSASGRQVAKWRPGIPDTELGAEPKVQVAGKKKPVKKADFKVPGKDSMLWDSLAGMMPEVGGPILGGARSKGRDDRLRMIMKGAVGGVGGGAMGAMTGQAVGTVAKLVLERIFKSRGLTTALDSLKYVGAGAGGAGGIRLTTTKQ